MDVVKEDDMILKSDDINLNKEINYEAVASTIENLLKTNEKSVDQVFEILTKEIENSNDTHEFYELCKAVREDYKKASENVNLSETERKDILEREIKIIEKAIEMEKEKQKNDMEIAKMVYEKDSENKRWLWGILGVAGAIVLTCIGVSSRKK